MNINDYKWRFQWENHQPKWWMMFVASSTMAEPRCVVQALSAEHQGALPRDGLAACLCPNRNQIWCEGNRMKQETREVQAF